MLGLTTFSADVDGTPVSLESVEAVVNDEAGIAVLLLIDVSGSMEGEPLAQARAAATAFVQGLLAQDVAAAVPFASRAPDEATFTGDRSTLLGGISSLDAEQEAGTALYDAVVNGLATVTGAPTARRAVVLLTDGRDSGGVSEHTRGDALLAAATTGLPIFAIGLGEDADVDFLRALAQEAGGGFYRAPAPSDVPAIFDAIGATLRSQYVLTLLLPPAGSAERELLVSLNLEGTTLTAQATFAAPVAIIDAGSESSRLPPWLWPALILTAVLLSAAAGATVVRWRLKRKPALAGGPGENVSVSIRTPDSPEPASMPSGRLTVVAGPNAGASVRLATGPIEIGSDPACDLRLDPVDGSVASTHARAWLQRSGLMLHHLARGRETLVEEKPIEWATLESNDTLRIGPHIIAFAVDGSP
jgi:hypothetical protein